MLALTKQANDVNGRRGIRKLPISCRQGHDDADVSEPVSDTSDSLLMDESRLRLPRRACDAAAAVVGLCSISRRFIPRLPDAAVMRDLLEFRFGFVTVARLFLTVLERGKFFNPDGARFV